jgi:MFS family permease
MYPSVREQLPGSGEETGRGLRGVGRTVVLLGFTSMFTDVSSEMVNAVLPIYLTMLIGLTPVQFGIVDGLYQGVTSFVQLAGGYVADRWRRYKEVAEAGYGISAICKLGLLLAGSAYGWITAVVAIDRTGKGIRTAPRDALISFSTPGPALGRAFGVHRAMDTVGAMAGPLIAFAILATMPRRFDTVFVVSFCFAVVGLAVLVLFVRNPGIVEAPIGPTRVSPLAALRELRGGRVPAVAAAGMLLSVATVSDGFVYLALQRRVEMNASVFPLLFVGTALVYLLLAAPVGRLADRVGRAKVYLAGYGLLLGVSALLLLPSPGAAGLVACLLLLGCYYAATDGVLAALASTFLPERLRTTGLALVATGVALAKLVASVGFGALWTWFGPRAAVAVFMGLLAVSLPIGALLLRRPRAEVVA